VKFETSFGYIEIRTHGNWLDATGEERNLIFRLSDLLQVQLDDWNARRSASCVKCGYNIPPHGVHASWCPEKPKVA